MAKEFSNLGKLLKDSRANVGLTQAELAQKLDVHTQFVSNWERGLCAPPNHSFQKVISTLKLDKTELADAMMKDSRISIEAKIFKKKPKKALA